jgi:dolichol-phosphate mannosyltransferase
MMNYHDACVIIPTRNEEETIGKLVEEVYEVGICRVQIVDDSDDATRMIATLHGAIPIQGIGSLGGAIRLGLNKAKELGFKYAVVMDAGGTHDPKMIPIMVEAARCGYQLVIASRFCGKSKFKGYRTLISLCAAFLARLVLSTDVSDVTSGFRCYQLDRVPLEKSKAKMFAVQIELFGLMVRTGCLFKEIRAEYKLTNSTFRWSMVTEALKVLWGFTKKEKS